jgi:hypothetical protein
MSKECDHLTIIALFIMVAMCCLSNIFICNTDKKIQDESDIFIYNESPLKY